MDKIALTTAERDALHSWRLHQPPPRVQRTMAALSLQSQGRAPATRSRLCAMATTTFSRSLQESREGGIAQRTEGPVHRRQRPWADSRARSAADVRQRPPARVAEAAARIAARTGRQRGPTQVRQCCKALGMPPRTVGQMPATAEVTAQEDVQTAQLERRWAEATSGQRVVCVLEAAQVVFAPFVGRVWGCERRCVTAPSGLRRANVLAALHATTRDSFAVTHLTFITSETVCEFLRRLAGTHPGVSRTIVLAHARSQRCAPVQRLAQRLGIALLFWPAYSRHLHRSERLWTCGKSRGCTPRTLRTISRASTPLSRVWSRPRTHTRRRWHAY